MRIPDQRARAETLVSSAAWDYLETGSGAEISLAEAESAWARWRFRPRALRDVRVISSECRLLGRTLRSPIGVAPTAYHLPYHPEGEVATARGAAAAGCLFSMSTRSSRTIEDVADVAGPWWMQVYVTNDRDITDAMVERAAGAGAEALVLTGDTPYVSRRARGDGLPISDEEAWANVQPHLHGRSWESLDQSPSITRADITRLGDCSGLPVLVKGILRADDAQACVDAGAAGVVVSNHGGRQVDRAVPTAHALAEVVDAVGDQVPVLVDGGIRSGHDVVTALAIGADAVLVGRPAIYALACDGADGVEAMLRHLTEETAHVMGLLGATSVTDLDRSLVVHGST